MTTETLNDLLGLEVLLINLRQHMFYEFKYSVCLMFMNLRYILTDNYKKSINAKSDRVELKNGVI